MGLRKHKASGQIAQRDIDQPALINGQDACATWSFLANFLNSRFKPFGFIAAESSAAIKLFQSGVAREDIKSASAGRQDKDATDGDRFRRDDLIRSSGN